MGKTKAKHRRIKKLVAVRLPEDLHERATHLARKETDGGRPMTVAQVYEQALRAFLGAATGEG